MKEFRSISSLLRDNLPDMEDPPVGDEIQTRLTRFWEIDLGDLSLYTFPVLFESGRLVIFCESAAWATRFRHQSPSVVRRLRESGFRVTRPVIKVHQVSDVKPETRQAARESATISADSARQIRGLAERVEHSGVRESLLRLAGKIK